MLRRVDSLGTTMYRNVGNCSCVCTIYDRRIFGIYSAATTSHLAL